jgi:hypothetical protein
MVKSILAICEETDIIDFQIAKLFSKNQLEVKEMLVIS